MPFSGPIGIKFSKCEKLPVVDYEVPDINPNSLSKDQQYLLHISSAVKSFNFAVDLSVRKLGPLSHSRRLTTANRVLRL